MSKSGTSEGSCLSQTDPCFNMTHAVETSTPGDAIEIIATGSETYPMEICAVEVGHDLIIASVKGTPIVQCSESHSAVFLIVNSTVTVRNLQILVGFIQTNEAHVSVKDCVFGQNSGISAMSKEVMHMHKSYPSLDAGSFTMDAVSEGTSEKACHRTHLEITNCVWLARTAIKPAPLDFLLQEGVQVICNEVEIKVRDTNFTDRQFYVSAFARIYLEITGSHFMGASAGSPHLGGVSIELFPSLPDPYIAIENCTFTNLKFDSIPWETAWNYIFDAAAVSTKVHQEFHMDMNASESHEKFRKYLNVPDDVASSDDYDYDYLMDVLEDNEFDDSHFNFHIINSVFVNNSRAVSIRHNENRNRPSVRIFNCSFRQNRVLLNGGAILVSGASSVIFHGCEFVDNIAGADIDPAEKVDNANITLVETFHFVLKEYVALSDNVRFLFEIYDSDFDHSAQFETNAGSQELTGKGGAIFCENSYCEVINSTFAGNFAHKYGGSLYSTSTGHFTLYHTHISETDAYSWIQGSILNSFGTLIMVDCSFTLQHINGSSANILTHFTEGNRVTAWISNISLRCPVNSRLYVSNASADLFSDREERLEYLGFKKLWYTCRLCATGDYSLQSGFIEVPDVVTLTYRVYIYAFHFISFNVRSYEDRQVHGQLNSVSDQRSAKLMYKLNTVQSSYSRYSNCSVVISKFGKEKQFGGKLQHYVLFLQCHKIANYKNAELLGGNIPKQRFRILQVGR